jgi:hypothetical protein
MAESGKKDLLLHDPLSEVTRKERRMLLGISMLGISVVQTGLVPSKISALGIEFAKSDQQTILSLLSLIVVYFLVAFVVYASSDFLAWRRALRAQLVEGIREKLKIERELGEEYLRQEQNMLMERLDEGYRLYSLSRPVSVLRAIFEFLFPILVGGYGAYLLWFTKIPINGT